MTLPHPFQRKTLKIMGERGSALALARGRIVLLSAVFGLCFIVIAVRAFDVMILQGAMRSMSFEKAELAPKMRSEESVRRADIVDRNGVLLATSLRMASLYADPHLVSDSSGTARALSGIFPDLVYGEVLQKLQSDNRFAWIKRNLTPDEQYKVLEIGDPGLAFRYEDKRIYPEGALTSHVVGYTDVDGRGLSGIERAFNNFLSVAEEDPLALTLDIRVQHILHRELAKAIDDFRAKGGAGLVMDVKNGELLAVVSLPDFDPHHPAKVPAVNLFNRATLGVYELGSTFKIFSIAALLDLKNVSLAKTFDASEPIKRGRFMIRDYHAQKRDLSIPEIFMYSSNIGSALIGEMVGTDDLKKFYADLGLLDRATLEIKELGRPIVPSPWRDINTLTASYGHGIAVSPLQLVSAVASIVNEGYFVAPTLIKSSGPGESVFQIVSPETSEKMRSLLRLVVAEGTGKNAEVPGYLVGGKTGTAEKSVNGSYDRKRLISSFIGAFPMDDPRYVVFVMVDEPKGTQESFGYATGGWVAAPAVGRIVASMAPLLGMAPVKEKGLEEPLKRYISYEEKH